MEPGVLQNVLLFLTDTLLSLYALAFVVRFLLTFAQADFYNPLSQTVVKLTQVPLNSMHAFFPLVGRVDPACGLIAYGLKTLALFLIGLIQGNALPVALLLTISLIQLGETIIYVYIFSLITLAISSWLMSGIRAFNHPLISLLYSLNAPLLTPVRRVIPVSGVVDFSPLVLLITLFLLLTILRSLY